MLRLLSRRKPSRRPRHARRFRPSLEILECRITPHHRLGHDGGPGGGDEPPPDDGGGGDPSALFDFQWALNVGGTSGDNARAVVDAEGNSYVSGFLLGSGTSFSSWVDLDPRPDVEFILTVPPGETGSYLAKYNPDGGLEWGRLIETSVGHLTVNPTGDIYVTSLISAQSYVVRAENLLEGATFSIMIGGWGSQELIFEFDSDGELWHENNIAIPFTGDETDAQLAATIAAAINATPELHETAVVVESTLILGTGSVQAQNTFAIHAQALVDGAMLFIADQVSGQWVVFEFDNNGEREEVEFETILIPFTGNETDAELAAILADAINAQPELDNVVATVVNESLLQLGNGSAEASVSLISRHSVLPQLAGSSYITIVQYSAEDGNLNWRKDLIGGSVQLSDLVVDNASNLYVSGHIRGHVDMNPDPEQTFILEGPGSVLEGSVPFVTKLDSDGGFVWAQIVPSSVSNLAAGEDAQGQPVLYGTHSFTFAGTNHVFRLDPSTGELLWQRSAEAIPNDRDFSSSFIDIHAVTTDSNGDVWMTGTFRGIVDFDPGSGSFVLESTQMKGGLRQYFRDAFIWKLNKDGNFDWAGAISDGGSDRSTMALYSRHGVDISSDNSGSVYVTGRFSGVADFNPGGGKFRLGESEAIVRAFVLKLANDGKFVWAVMLGADGDPSSGGTAASGRGIAVDKHGNVYASGIFFNTQDFDPTNSRHWLTSNGHSDLYLVKLGQPVMAGTASLTTFSTSSHDDHHASLTAHEEDDAAPTWTANVAAPSALPLPAAPGYSAPPQTPPLPRTAIAAGRLESLPHDRPAPEWLPEAALLARPARAAETARDLLFADDDPLGLELSPASV